MTRNNVKLLTKNELLRLNSQYIITYDDNNIIVGNRHYNRTTLHDRNKSFFINSKVRKITLTTSAIEIWIKLQEEKEFKDYTLFDVQNAVNMLYVMYQPCELKEVKKVLTKESLRINDI